MTVRSISYLLAKFVNPGPDGELLPSDISDLVESLNALKAELSHTHAQSDVTGLPAALAGKSPTGHVHTQADVSGLVADLAGKAAAVHTHAQSEVTGLPAALAGKAASTHTHTTGDITGLLEWAQDAIAAMFTTNPGNVTPVYDDAAGTIQLTAPAAGGGLDAEGVRDVMGLALEALGLLQIVVNDAGDKITFTTTATANATDAFLRALENATGTLPQSQVTNLVSDLAGKAATVHQHSQSQVTNLVSDLAGKAPTSHTHAQADVTNLVSDLAGKAAASHTHATSQVVGLDAALAGKAAASHTHGVADLTATGTRDATKFLRGDNTWQTPPTSTPVIYVGASWTSITPTDDEQALINAAAEGMNFYLPAGTYNRFFARPKNRQYFHLAPGVIMDGQGLEQYAFLKDKVGGGLADYVTIFGDTDVVIKNYVASQQHGAITAGSHSITDGARGWIVKGSRPRALRITGTAGFGRYGIRVGTDMTLENLAIDRNDGLGVGGVFDNGRMIDCYIGYNNPTGLTDAGFEAGGFKFVVGRYCYIEGGLIEENQGAGAWFDEQFRTARMRNVVTRRNYGAGFMFEKSYDFEAEGCVSIEDGYPHGSYIAGAAFQMNSSPRITLRACRVVNSFAGIVISQQNRPDNEEYGTHTATDVLVEDCEVAIGAPALAMPNDPTQSRRYAAAILQDVSDPTVFDRPITFRRNTYNITGNTVSGALFETRTTGKTSFAAWQADLRDVAPLGRVIPAALSGGYILNAQDVTQSPWDRAGGVTVASSAESMPSGWTGGFQKVTAIVGTNQYRFVRQQPTIPAGTMTYIGRFRRPATNGHRYLSIRLADEICVFDFNTGTFIVAGGTTSRTALANGTDTYQLTVTKSGVAAGARYAGFHLGDAAGAELTTTAAITEMLVNYQSLTVA
jgi:hypothetical protein